MFFFKALYNSLWNFSWLKAQRHAPGKAWGYFSLFVLLLCLVSVVPIAATLPQAGEEIKNKINELPQFEATLKKGEMTITGVEQPLVRREDNSVFVIDTVSTSTLSLAQFMTSSDRGGLLITKNKFELIDKEENREQVQNWEGFPDFSTNKEKVLGTISRYTGAVVVGLGSLLLIVVFFVVIFIAKLWSILVVSLLAWAVSGLAKRGWKFGELYTVGLYAITLPTIVSLTLKLLGVHITLIHFLIFLAFMAAMVITKDDKAQVDTTSTPV